MRTCPREAGPPGPRLSSRGERERHTAMSGGAGEVNMLLSLFSLQLPLTHNLSNKVRGRFFKDVFARLYHCVVMILHAHVDVYVLCVCIVNHGHDHGYTTHVLTYKIIVEGLIFISEYLTVFSFDPDPIFRFK